MENEESKFLLNENKAIVDYLKESRLFSHLSDDYLKQLLPLSNLEKIEEGDIILQEGASNNKVYFLMRGKVNVYASGELILSLSRKGDIFGEMSIISNKPCSATIMAVTPVQVFSIHAKNVGKYTDIDADTLHNVLYRVFSAILTEKLATTTYKAKNYEEAKQELEITNKNLNREIAKYEHSEKQLVKSEKLLQLVLESSRIGVWSILLDGASEWNELSLDFIGSKTNPESFEEYLNCIYSADREHVDSVLEEATNDFKDHEFECRFLHKDGQIVWVLNRNTFLKDNEGNIKGLMGSMIDITERKLAEEKILKINADLKKSNDGLMQTKYQLMQSAKLASLGELASGLAIELNQPLSLIRDCANDGLSNLKSGNSNIVESSLNNIDKQVKQVSKIIEHLGVFAQDASDDSFREIDLNEIIKNSFLLINEQLKMDGIEVKIDLSENLAQMMGNAIQLEQVLSNLLVNAKDALNALTTSDKKSISVQSFKKDNEVLIEIKDTGTGIAPRIQNTIFDPFFTTKQVGKGTGLGLSISHNVIHQHKGIIEIESEEGAGALFRIRLPIE